ncbi:hypothetical protein IT568_07760 [bacterium]|nr:hypothetical protein [bacterium]
MKSTDNLFQLIKALNKTEKRYFKVVTSKEESFYTKLFDEIDRQTEYDEKKLIKKLKSENSVRNLSIAKSRLYELILKSLDVFHSELSVEKEIRRNLGYIEILFHKELFEQAKKLLLKTKKIARFYEKEIELLKILTLEGLLNKEADFRLFKTQEELLEHYENLFSSLDKLRNITDLNFIYDGFSLAVETGNSENYFKISDEIVANPILSDEKNAKSFQEKSAFHNIWMLYYHFQKDYEKSLETNLKLANLFEANPQQIRENVKSYNNILTNTALSYFTTKNFVQMKKTIEKLKITEANFQISEKNKIKNFNLILGIELAMFLTSGDFEEGYDFVKKAEKQLEEFSPKIPKKQLMHFWVSIAHTCFVSGDNSLALKYYNKILNDEETEIKQNIRRVAKIMILFVHFELGNESLFESLVRSTYYFLEKRKEMADFEKCVLRFFGNKFPKLTDEEELKLSFTELKNELEIVVENEKDFVSDFYIDLVFWLESKITCRTFLEVVKEKRKL